MKNEKYYVGFDIGTDSVGYAVAKESYDLCKFKGEPMWGVHLFDEAELSNKRRLARVARRRLDRRQQRIQLLQELFAFEIANVDADFYKRIKNSYLFSADDSQKVRLFGTWQEQKAYMEKYPTIHHLICELMESTEAHDVRLVYVACAWLLAHRGHFLSEVNKDNIDKITDFRTVYQKLESFIISNDEYALPWNKNVDIVQIGKVLQSKLNITEKSKQLSEVLFGGKAPTAINETFEYNYSLAVKLLCGGECQLDKLFGKEEYAELEEKKLCLRSDEEKLTSIMQSVEEREAELIHVLKEIYDWSILADILKDEKSISAAKVATYEQHKKDLKDLKKLIKKYAPAKYDEIFRWNTLSDQSMMQVVKKLCPEKTFKTPFSESDRKACVKLLQSRCNAGKFENNYVAYIGASKVQGKKTQSKKTTQELFCTYIKTIFKTIKPSKKDEKLYQEIMARLEINDFMPKQVDGDNRVIPYQLYWHELNAILKNAKGYIPFLSERDEDDLSGAEKILSVFEFRVPYYVGPLNAQSPFAWLVRKREGKILPWNFEKMVDLDASEQAFIKKMINSCTYLPCEDVLPKQSLVYCAFEVLNEINNIKINGKDISVEVKQGIYNDLFLHRKKAVSVKDIEHYLVSNGHMQIGDVLGGLDEKIKSSLKPFKQFERLVSSGLLTYADVEKIIIHATCAEEKNRFSKWLRAEFEHLSENEIVHMSGLKFKEFGRLSRVLLCGIEGVNTETGEVYASILSAMWETNCNLMQLMSQKFTFRENAEQYVREHYDLASPSASERLDDMYISNAVKRPIIRTLDIMQDIVKAQGQDPERIFIEMARGATEEQKGKRTKTRLEQIQKLYEQVKNEDVLRLSEQLEKWGDEAHSKLQSDKVFLYFIQLGKCLYTGESIPLQSIINGDGLYNVDHIRPRSFVKDDSVISNLVLVSSKENERKGDGLVPRDIIGKMKEHWKYLNSISVNGRKLLSDEKLERLMRTTPFTDEEKFEFINRQLVETRQSTKALASLLKELYPSTEIVYVKAGLISDFRRNFSKRKDNDPDYQDFDLPKSRAVNDLHHAKDAYLSIVVGNVWHFKFSKAFWRTENSNAKPEVVFTHPVVCGEKTVWRGAEDKKRVVSIAKKNAVHITVYSYYKHSGQNGGFFDQKPIKAGKDLIPLKAGMPTEIYGGYNSATVTGFLLVKYKVAQQTQVSFVPLTLLDMQKVAADDKHALEYVQKELGEKAYDITFLFNKRVFKIYTMLSLDGARYCIRGKASSSKIGVMNMMPFLTSLENERYIKRLEVLHEKSEKYKKSKKDGKYVWSEQYDGVSQEKNIVLYAHYIQKLTSWPYCTRHGNDTFVGKLKTREKDFAVLDVLDQTAVLLQIQGALGRMKFADLKLLKESTSSGETSLSFNLVNWTKEYADVRIIDQSASGLYEQVSYNLLDLLTEES